MKRWAMGAALALVLAATSVVGGAIVLRPGGPTPVARGSSPPAEPAALL